MRIFFNSWQVLRKGGKREKERERERERENKTKEKKMRKRLTIRNNMIVFFIRLDLRIPP